MMDTLQHFFFLILLTCATNDKKRGFFSSATAASVALKGTVIELNVRYCGMSRNKVKIVISNNSKEYENVGKRKTKRKGHKKFVKNWQKNYKLLQLQKLICWQFLQY